MLNLVDLLNVKGIALENCKIHLATGIASSPLDAFLAGIFQEWQDGQNQKNFQCDFILSLVSIEGDKWVLQAFIKC